MKNTRSASPFTQPSLQKTASRFEEFQSAAWKSTAGPTWFPLLSPKIHRAPWTQHRRITRPWLNSLSFGSGSPALPVTESFPLRFPPPAIKLTSSRLLCHSRLPLISCLFIRPLIHSSPAICSDLPHTPNSSFCIHALALCPRYLFSSFTLPLSHTLFFFLLVCSTYGRVSLSLSLSLRLSLLLLVNSSALHTGTLFLLRWPSICLRRWTGHVLDTWQPPALLPLSSAAILLASTPVGMQ